MVIYTFLNVKSKSQGLVSFEDVIYATFNIHGWYVVATKANKIELFAPGDLERVWGTITPLAQTPAAPEMPEETLGLVN